MFRRSAHKAGFTVIDNGILNGGTDGLSLAARGLMATILSLPDKWEFSERGLAKIVPDGRRRVHGAICELEEAGYIVRGGQGRDRAGRLTAQVWSIIESPQVTTAGTKRATVTSRENGNNSQVTTDARNGTADANRENSTFAQVTTDARFPRTDNVQQYIKKDEIRTIKGGASASAKKEAEQPPSCPECGKSTERTGSTRNERRERLYRCPVCGEEVWVDR